MIKFIIISFCDEQVRASVRDTYGWKFCNHLVVHSVQQTSPMLIYIFFGEYESNYKKKSSESLRTPFSVVVESEEKIKINSLHFFVWLRKTGWQEPP